MPRRRLIGTITSVKMHETALVRVDHMKTHPLYGKRYRRSEVYAVHNPLNSYQLADNVLIEEHRPISKTKHWTIRERLSKGVTDVRAAGEADVQVALSAALPEETDLPITTEQSVDSK